MDKAAHIPFHTGGFLEEKSHDEVSAEDRR